MKQYASLRTEANLLAVRQCHCSGFLIAMQQKRLSRKLMRRLESASSSARTMHLIHPASSSTHCEQMERREMGRDALLL